MLRLPVFDDNYLRKVLIDANKGDNVGVYLDRMHQALQVLTAVPGGPEYASKKRKYGDGPMGETEAEAESK